MEPQMDDYTYFCNVWKEATQGSYQSREFCCMFISFFLPKHYSLRLGCEHMWKACREACSKFRDTKRKCRLDMF